MLLQTKVEQYKKQGIKQGIERNSHMNNFRGNTTEQDCVAILDRFIQSIGDYAMEGKNLGFIADELVYYAKIFGCSTELEKAVVVDFVNFAVMPLDLGLYSCDI